MRCSIELYLSMKLCISCKQMNQFCYYHDGISSLFSFILLVFYFVKFVMYTCQQFSQIYISVITVLNLVCLLVLFRFSFKLYRLHFVGDCLICFQILKRAIQYRTVRYILYWQAPVVFQQHNTTTQLYKRMWMCLLYKQSK